MRKIQGIRWKESVGNKWQNENNLGKGMPVAAEIIHATVCTVIFMCATRIMLEDVFSWAKLGVGTILLMAIMTILVSGIMEMASRVSREKAKVTGWCLLPIGAICFILFLWIGGNFKTFASGMQKIASLYIVEWNDYFDVEVKCSGGSEANITFALNFLIVCIAFLTIWGARMLRRNVLLSIVPFLVLIAELSVGYSPKGVGVFFVLTGILLSNTLSWKASDFRLAPGSKNNFSLKSRYFMWFPVGVWVLIVCVLVNFTGASAAAGLIKYSDEIKEFQEEFLDGLENWSFWDIFSGDSKVAELNNDTPEYDHEPVLKITIDSRPLGNIYLKGFYADTYDDGVWEADLDSFEDACDDEGYDVDEISEKVANLAVTKLADIYGWKEGDDYAIVSSASMEYIQSTGTKAYLPYFVYVDADKVGIEGDSRFEKDSSTDKLSFYLWELGTSYESYVSSIATVSIRRWETWYEEYVDEHYLEVPDDLTNVHKVAEEISKKIEDIGYTSASYNGDNRFRLYAAECVVDWMKANTKYSTNLPELPSGEDPIEYFLGTSKTGYCMHYASASVMILRELGVPARYVSGYIANRSLFSSDGDNYVATILDDKAHAWVEIYLNGVGWVPVEVTKGYTSSSINIDDDNDEPDYMQDDDDLTEEITTKNDIEDDEPQEQESKNSSEGNEDDDVQLGIASSSGGTGGSGGNIFKVLKVLLIVAVILAVMALIVWGFLRVKADYRNKLLRQMRGKKTLRAIKTMNRRIYRKLRTSGKVFKSSLTDGAYEEILKKTYVDIPAEEWQHYMTIVKAAEFSRREFSVDEMEFCYGIYRRVIRNS